MEKNYKVKTNQDIYLVDEENHSASYVQAETIEYLLNRQHQIILELKEQIKQMQKER